MEQSRERSSALPLHLGVIAFKKGAFESLSTKVANFAFFFFFTITTHSKMGWPLEQQTAKIVPVLLTSKMVWFGFMALLII